MKVKVNPKTDVPVEAAIEKIRDLILPSLQYGGPLDRGALSASSGYLLFLLNYAKVFDDQATEQLAYDLLDAMFDKSKIYQDEHDSTITYCSGILGTGWTFLHVRNHGFVEFEDAVVGELDDVAMTFIERMMKRGNYDFLHGAGGGIYYLMQKNKTAETVNLLEKAVQLLLDESIIENGYQYWPSYDLMQDKKEPGIINLGLSHGVPSIVALLSRLYLWDKKFDYLEDVIRSSVVAVRLGRNKTGMGSLYPYVKKIGHGEGDTSRVGWCYGDLGVAVSLWQAGEAIGEEGYKEEAIEILRHVSTRRSYEDSSVKDAGLCHGAAGISHILRKYYVLTGDETMLEASDFWLGKTLELIQPVDGLFTAKCKWDAKAGYVNCFSLLEGISGVGLALLSACTNETLQWDETLIIGL